MNLPKRKHAHAVAWSTVALAITTIPSLAADDAWVKATIDDALLAAPPSVTDDAGIYGWTPEGDLVLARFGTGPYTCIASGSFSLRLGKPSLPYPDPMCLDQNAWAFLQALWSGSASEGGASPLPTAPGLIWMLAGMNVSKGAVDIGASGISVEESSSSDDNAEVVQMTPHIMIMPLPFEESNSSMTTKYNLDNPLDAWIMAVGKPHEHLMVHFPAEDVSALMATGN